MTHIEFRSLILFEDPDYLILNKPAGISTLADRNDSLNVLGLARAFDPNLTVCHRLDKETSGVIVLARNPEAYRFLAMQFEQREVNKIYRAVVNGRHNFEDEVIDLPLFSSRSGITQINHRRGKDSKTVITTLQTFRFHSLLECKPVTGRMHQIRAHLGHLGAPIIGDEKYGGNPLYLSALKRNYRHKNDREEQALINRPPLHSFQINFEKQNREKVAQQAPYPKDLNALLNQLSKHL